MKYTEKIAVMTQDPKILIKILKRGKDNPVSDCAAGNINCPPEILVEILRRGNNDHISWNAAMNPNCPKEILVEILRREKDDNVSVYSANNPNCPLEAKIKWMQVTLEARIKLMQETGQIEKEDPSKHIIEYENNKIDDLQDLKDLLKNC